MNSEVIRTGSMLRAMGGSFLAREFGCAQMGELETTASSEM